MIARRGPCLGITVFRWRRFKVELWFAPADYAPPEHVHRYSSSEFLILFARRRRIFRRVETPKGLRTDQYVADTRKLPWWKFRTLSVRYGVRHAFCKGASPMIWLAFETWKKGVKITSVAEDFEQV